MEFEMKKLDYELTKKMFDCKTKEDVQNLQSTGADFATCSRLSIDEVLSKVFNRTCHGTKDLAIQMIVGELNGQYVPDVADTNVSTESNGDKIVGMDPTERMNRISSRLDEIVSCIKSSDILYVKKAVKDPELKLLSASEEDIVRISSKVTDSRVLCQGLNDKKFYFIKNEESAINMVKSWSDVIISQFN